jgi:hypothetical protein
MSRAIIPWQVFLESLDRQPRPILGEWLTRWGFGDDGVFAVFENPQPAKDLRRQVENTVLQLIKPNRGETIH